MPRDHGTGTAGKSATQQPLVTRLYIGRISQGNSTPGTAASVSTEAYRSCQEKGLAPLREPELRLPLPTPFLFPVFWLPFRFLHACTSHHQSRRPCSIGNHNPPSRQNVPLGNELVAAFLQARQCWSNP